MEGIIVVRRAERPIIWAFFSLAVLKRY